MTPYEKIFKSFLAKIQDPLYVQLEIHVAEDDLLSLMNAAILNFEYPKIDLKDKDDDTQQFTNELGFDEIEILGHLMAYEWMKRELRSIDALRQFTTVRDFNAFSQANHINALVNAERRAQREIKRLKIKYSMRDGNTSNLKVLGGDGG